MNTTDVETLVSRALKNGYGIWVDTDMGELELFGSDLEQAYDNLAPGEGFSVLGILTKEES